MEAVKFFRVKKIIYSASSSCYGIPNKYPTKEKSDISPQYPYALTKYMGEQIILHWGKLYNIKVISLRLFNVYGLRSRTTGAYGAVFGVFLAQKLSNKPLTVVGDGTQSRDFTYVTDVVRAFILAMNANISGITINIGSRKTYKINYLVKLLKHKYVYIPKRPGEPDITWADISNAKQYLKWEPKISLSEGVSILLKNINMWKDAPVWNKKSIKKATKKWFEHLN